VTPDKSHLLLFDKFDIGRGPAAKFPWQQNNMVLTTEKLFISLPNTSWKGQVLQNH